MIWSSNFQANTEEADKEMIVRIKKENENLTLHLLLNE